VTDADVDVSVPTVHQRIGDEIRAARENTGFTLEQVSRETRVHISHLRAIEEMTPGLLGAPVYAKGYIKSYARFLGMDEHTTLDRYLSECAAILKDPEKIEIAQPASSKTRKLPVAVPVLGILVVALVGGGAMLMLNGGDKSPAAITDPATANAGAGVAAEVVAPQLRIVVLKRGHLIVRSSNGTKFVDRDFYTDEVYVPRVGSQWTVTTDDGAAFEWRLGDQSLGLMQAEGGPVYSQSIDLAAQRQPIVVAPPVDPNAAVAPQDPALDAYPATPGAPTGATAANPAPAKPKPPKPVPAPSTNTAPAPAKPDVVAPPVHDPALDAYPDQAPPATPAQ
jgi:transcriptional regulator with XRE-family HTH domain